LLMKTLLPAVLLLFACSWLAFRAGKATVSQRQSMIRIARLEIDSTQLDPYRTLLKEEIEASIKLEPGVLTLYAVAEKGNPNRITVFEIYADEAAYRSHLETPHFKKYKTGTQNMVKFLDLKEVEPILLGRKKKM
jgi:quinol monooxygenase YgiN